MEKWTVTLAGKSIQPVIIQKSINQSDPKLLCEFEGKIFSIEFRNKTDYMAARHRTNVEVEIVSKNRKNRFWGYAFNDQKCIQKSIEQIVSDCNMARDSNKL